MTATVSEGGETWVGTAQAGARLGCSAVTIWRLIRAGRIPAIRSGRAYRIPGEFVDDAYQAVMNGGQVVLADFGRQWVTHHRPPVRAVA